MLLCPSESVSWRQFICTEIFAKDIFLMKQGDRRAHILSLEPGSPTFIGYKSGMRNLSL